jgi:hypothetical protein
VATHQHRTPQSSDDVSGETLALGGRQEVGAIVRKAEAYGNQVMQSVMQSQQESYGLGQPLAARSLPGADRDNADGDQVIVADTGPDMDLWVAVTGQEQATGGLDGVVDAVVDNADGEPIDRVEFKSHGTANWQQVAAGAGGVLRSPLTESQRSAFQRLGQHMSPGGVIVLAGCQVAGQFQKGAAGIPLMLEVAECAGVAVEAGVAIQLPLDGIEGTMITAYPDGTYVIDTSVGQQLFDVTADGLADLLGASGVRDIADTAGEVASGFGDAITSWWNGDENPNYDVQ